MPYYGGRGDYYRGDYYRGDLKGFLRGAAGVVGKVAGALTNPVGTAAGLLGSGPPRPPSGRGIESLPLVGGAAKKIRQLVHPGTQHVRRRRRMNPLNVKALRRADRRARAFLKISKSLVHHYEAKQPKGRSFIRARKRKR